MYLTYFYGLYFNQLIYEYLTTTPFYIMYTSTFFDISVLSSRSFEVSSRQTSKLTAVITNCMCSHKYTLLEQEFATSSIYCITQ